MVTVDGGPVPGQNFANVLYADVTVCAPGTSQCQTISGIEVDTGSSGLRILASALTLSLPRSSGPGGGPLAECLQYVNSSTWGSVRTADVKLAGETGLGIPVQVIGDPEARQPPASCTSGGFPASDTQLDLGANGVLGVGNYVEDCGSACGTTGASNPGLYYECPSPSSCHVTALGLAQQVANPVASFTPDDNGVVITLPAVADHSPTLTGTMTLGIGTHGNNALGDAKVLTFDQNGYLNTQLKGASLPYSFVDSGSSFFAFPDSSIPQCKDYEHFFCPEQRVQLSATMRGANGASQAVPFAVDNADVMLALNASVFATVSSSNIVANGSAGGPSSFDWGLPFYFGRTVFSALEGRSTPVGPGPYIAFR
jgi:hypothetical protein